MILDFFRQGADAEAQAVPEQKASATGRVVAWGGAGRVAWSPRDVVSLARTGFAGNPVGFRCVKMIAEAGAGAGGTVRGAFWSVVADRQCLCRGGGCGRRAVGVARAAL